MGFQHIMMLIEHELRDSYKLYYCHVCHKCEKVDDISFLAGMMQQQKIARLCGRKWSSTSLRGDLLKHHGNSNYLIDSSGTFIWSALPPMQRSRSILFSSVMSSSDYHGLLHPQRSKPLFQISQILQILKCLKDPTCAIFFKSMGFKDIKYDIPVYQKENTPIHKYPNTQIQSA